MIKKLLLFGVFTLGTSLYTSQVNTKSGTPLTKQKQQEPTYEDLMSTAMKQFESANSVVALQSAYDEFMKIGKKEKKEWIPYYYAAFAQKKRGDLFLKENKIKDLDDAIYFSQKSLDESKRLSPNNVEIYVIQKYLYQLRKNKIPSEIYQSGGPLALQVLSSAYKLDDKNPRVLLLKAEDLVNTPKEYGGDKEKGIEMYKKALSQFSSYKVKVDKDRKPILFYPTWGKELAQEALEKKK